MTTPGGPARRRTLLATGALLATGLAVVAVPAVPAAATTGTVTIIARGLDNPRSLAFASDGHLYVAEAGHGGSECPSQATGPEGQQCAGLSGALARVALGHVTVVESGFPSVASPQGIGAEGLSGLAAHGTGLLGVVNSSAQQVPPGFSAGLHDQLVNNLGRLLEFDLGTHTSRRLADVGTTDWNWANGHKSLDPQFPDANPYFVAVGPDGGTLVVDAASNTVDSESLGQATVRRFIPNGKTGDAVPTCLAVGPDHALYVGGLGAAGSGVGAQDVYRFLPGQPLRYWHGGFTTITGCGFDRAGNFYATELQVNGFNPGPKGDPRGAVVKVSSDQRTRTVLGYGQLDYPQGFALSPDGTAILVSNWTLMPGTAAKAGSPTGQVARIAI